jgi:DNA-binding transcriptional ArsR family regulator
VPVKTLERWLKLLKEKNMIEFRGSRRFGGYWINKGREHEMSGGISEGINEGIDEGVKSLLVLVQEMPGLRAPQLSKALGVPAKTLERWLKLLKEKNMIEFRGSRRFGGYRRRESGSEGSPVE